MCVVCEIKMEKNGKESMKTSEEISVPAANDEEPEVKYRGIKVMPFIIGKIQIKQMYFSAQLILEICSIIIICVDDEKGMRHLRSLAQLALYRICRFT